MLIGTALVWLLVPVFCHHQPKAQHAPEHDRLRTVEILIVGAGPAGSVAAALLRQQGRQVLVIEREQFPRFSIGESLLPQSMAYLEEAGMLQAVVEAGFQFKNGAAFMRDGGYTDFDFRDKHSARAGAPPTRCSAPTSTICWPRRPSASAPRCAIRHEVTAVDLAMATRPRVAVKGPDGEHVRRRSRLHARRQRLRAHPAAPAEARDAVELPGARRARSRTSRTAFAEPASTATRSA